MSESKYGKVGDGISDMKNKEKWVRDTKNYGNYWLIDLTLAVAFISAPLSRRVDTIFAWPLCAAIISALEPS